MERSLKSAGNFSRERYTYDVLPTDCVRVFELHPDKGSLLSCSLRTHKLEELASKYEALSYVCGSDAIEDKIQIECDGRSLPIYSNLALALTHVRSEARSRLLWADAICIDQADEDERSRQVQRMSDIYANASRVLVWIGDSVRDEAAECFQLIQKTNTFLDDLYLQYQDVEQIPPMQDQEIFQTDRAEWDMVRRLMDSPWFTRVWVLQEVGLAKSATMYYGNATMEWSQLVELMLFVASRADVSTRLGNVQSGMFWDVFEGVWCSFANKESWRNELPFTRSLNNQSSVQGLVDVLSVTRPYCATDQRDHIYAFLGHPLASTSIRSLSSILTADYKKSTDTVYLETATQLLKNDENPWTVLSSVDHKPDSPSLSGERPSWVPRWDEYWYTYWLGYASMWYRAGGNTPARFSATTSENGAVLLIQGTILDTIIWHSPAFDSEELRLENQLTGAPIQELWRQLQQELRYQLQQQLSERTAHYEDSEFAFSLVMVAGRAANDGPAEDDPDMHRSVYEEHKKFTDWDGLGGAPNATISKANGQSPETILQVNARTYIANQRRAMHNRRCFLTSTGYLGIGHRALGIGDRCVIVKGANVPFILHEVIPGGATGTEPTRYKLIGESYIQGVMRGGLFDGRGDGSDTLTHVAHQEEVLAID